MTAPIDTTTLGQVGAQRTAASNPGEALTPAKHHPQRWRMSRAGIVNVWFYYDVTFEFSGGRMILRGTNGSGKSRALEMLLPFVLDGERRKMDATGSGKVRLEDLMKAGSAGQTNRLGYLWLELVRDGADEQPEYLTLGALVRFSAHTSEAKAWYFTTDARVGHDLVLLDADRQPLSRDKLSEQIGADRILDSPEAHRERIRAQVFGLTGQAGKERFAGLMQLLHTLRSPDVGNRIDEGKLPQILSDALPPLGEAALKDAGERLDGLSEARAAQTRLENALEQVTTFLDVYRRYTAATLHSSAQGVRTAAAKSRDADTDAKTAATTRDALSTEHADTAREAKELYDHLEELAGTITGIRSSREYSAARDLDARERSVVALATAAHGHLSTALAARREESEAVSRLDQLAAELVTAAEQVTAALALAREQLDKSQVPTGALPEQVTVRLEQAAARTDAVRTDLDGDLSPTNRPTPLLPIAEPTDPLAVAQAADAAAASASSRSGQAAAREATARAVDAQHGAVRGADKSADDAEYRSNTEADEAEQAAADRDAAGRALASAWRSWTAAPQTDVLLGQVDWPLTAAGPALLDIDAFEGDAYRLPSPTDTAADAARNGDVDSDELLPEPTGLVDLDLLDRTADHAARPAREVLTRRRATLDAEQHADETTRGELESEQEQLRAAADPVPPRAPWAGPDRADAVSLWRAVEFTDTVHSAAQAGLEAALMAAGLLTATLSGDGSVVAADGQTLLTADAPPAARPVTAVLRPDASSPADHDRVRAVLERISLGDTGEAGGTWVDMTGEWRNGPLRGRHRVPAPRHIGAAARAAARAQRLAELEIELAALDERAAQRDDERRTLTKRERDLDAHVRTAPRSRPLAEARVVAEEKVRRAAASRREAERLRATAEQLRTKWAQASREHRETCDSQGLPYDADALRTVATAAERAHTAAGALAHQVRVLAQRLIAHARVVEQLAPVQERRSKAEQSVAQHWEAWHGEASELAAVRENIGRQAQEVQRRLSHAQREHARGKAEHGTTAAKAERLGREAAAAEVRATSLAETAQRLRGELTESVAGLRRQLALPGVAAAATRQSEFDGAALLGAQLDAAAADRAAKTVIDALDRRGAAVDASGLLRAHSTLDRELSATFDVAMVVTDGVHLVELADATGRRPIAAAHTELERQAADGRAALTDREYEVFTQFVLGGVGEELRRRLAQAEQLVAAMNDSLSSIRTSHGIGVTLTWQLAEAAGSPVARIRELVRTAGDVRSAADSEELIALLRAQVDEQFALDATAGYATHLKNALDYRRWHNVEVIILGPAEGQKRRISRRAKLSQGETRFVSYVALFAAADAYLSGLPDPGALRLILLDDAFAKVDERTIGELMGLLVRLDVDFAMTGHALWGTYTQVPSLDVYEVRRAEGTAAVTTHVHWDGRNRHLRAAR